MINLIIAGIFTLLFAQDARLIAGRGAKISPLLVAGISAVYFLIVLPLVFGDFPFLIFTLGIGSRYGIDAKTVWLIGVILPVVAYGLISYRYRKQLKQPTGADVK